MSAGGVLDPRPRCVRLGIGASHACLACMLRQADPGPCVQCGRATVSLDAPPARERLGRAVAVRVRRDRQQRRRAERPFGRHPAWTAFAHLAALASAGTAARLAMRLKTHGYVHSGLVALIAAVLGAIAGYVLVATLPVLAAVLGMVLFAAGSLIAMGTAAVATLVSYGLGRERGARMRRSIAYALGTVSTALASRLDGIAPASWRRALGLGLEPVAPSGPGADAPAIEGTLRAATVDARLGDARGAIVGARGVTRGATVCDALVAPSLTVHTTEGETVLIDLAVGEVCVAARSAREAWIDEDAPVAWGIPSRGSHRTQPPARTVEVFAVPDGASVRAEGGVLEDRARAMDTDGSYREIDHARVLRGTFARPLRLTVIA